MATDEERDVSTSMQDDLADGIEISECASGFKRIQEFVTEKSRQQQDTMFFQVKCMNGNQQQPQMSSIKPNAGLTLESSSANKLEARTKTSMSFALDSDFQSFVAVNTTLENADGNSDSLGGTNMTGTVVEDDARMLNLMTLANTSISTQLNSNNKGGRITNSQERILVSSETSRRTRAPRAPTVISVPGFSFQKLPDLFPAEEQPAKLVEEVTQETNTNDATLEFTEKRESAAVHRKLKMRISPKRVVVPDVETRNLDDSDRRFHLRHPRRAKQAASLQVVEELLQEEYSSISTTSDTPPKKKRRNKKAKLGRPRKTRRQDTSPQEAVKKRSLRSVIQKCLRKRRGGTKQQIPSDGSRPHQLETQNKTVNIQHGNPTKILADDHSIRFDKDMWNCPIVTDLLTKKLVNVGDTVELLTKEADPLFHGWFTTRGILCSNCGMVHSCNTFGACDGQSGTPDRLCVENGATLKQLLSGHDGVDFQ